MLHHVRLASRLRSKYLSVSFDGLKIAVGVLMGSDKSLSHKIFVSFVISFQTQLRLASRLRSVFAKFLPRDLKSDRYWGSSTPLLFCVTLYSRPRASYFWVPTPAACDLLCAPGPRRLVALFHRSRPISCSNFCLGQYKKLI
jgi:hypothetical protein